MPDNQQTNIAAGLAEENNSVLGTYHMKFPENYRRAEERRARAEHTFRGGDSPVSTDPPPDMTAFYPSAPGDTGAGPGTGSGPTTYAEKNVTETKFGPDAV